MGPWYWEARAHLSSHITLPGCSLQFQLGQPCALSALHRPSPCPLQ